MTHQPLTRYIQQRGRTPPPIQHVTLTGFDPATNETIQTINVFDRLPWGKRIGTAAHGARVTLIRRSGSGRIAQIRTADGVAGYVSANFIQEWRGPNGQLPA
jgi:hypothetical protein